MSIQPDFILKDTENTGNKGKEAPFKDKKGVSSKKNNGSCGAGTHLPEISFATFIISLNASALVNMGMMNDPMSDTKSVNLVVAKQTIDTLSMLERKTDGNLSHEEKQLLTNILYELRINYVKKTTC